MTIGRGSVGARRWAAVCVSLFSISLLLCLVITLGADLFWLVALGDDIRANQRIPDGVPFAAAPSDGWPPVLLVAQYALSLVHEAGLAGLLIWHYVLVLLTLVVVAVDARRRGASDLATAWILVVLLLGGLATFGVARLQTFSLLPFAAMLLLLRSQHRHPDRWIWMAPVLIVIWGNLHGAALMGVCVVGAYLLFSRLRSRPLETVIVGAACLAALVVTPAMWRTIEYYLGVLENEAALQGEGLWASPSLGNAFDVLMVASALALGAVALRRRMPLWEYVAVAGLTSATAMAARHGIWVLILLAVPAACGLTRRKTAETAKTADTAPHLAPVGLLITLALLIAVGGGWVGYRAQAVSAIDKRLASEVSVMVPDGVVLAPEPVVESLAVHGVRVWLGNPLDAFTHEDQRAYLDFLAGRPGMERAVAASDAVLVRPDAEAADVMASMETYTVSELSGGWLLYVRVDTP